MNIRTAIVPVDILFRLVSASVSVAMQPVPTRDWQADGRIVRDDVVEVLAPEFSDAQRRGLAAHVRDLVRDIVRREQAERQNAAAALVLHQEIGYWRALARWLEQGCGGGRDRGEEREIEVRTRRKYEPRAE
jgi:hypothetical protein